MALKTLRRATSAGALLAVLAPAGLAAQATPAAEMPLRPLKVIDPSYVDAGANACANFFRYANGAWLARDTIPAAYSSSGVSRDMAERNQLVVREVLEDAMRRRATLPAGSTERKLGTFYATCMDSVAAERAGVAPVRPALERIAAIRTRAGLLPVIAALHREGMAPAFSYRADVDLQDASRYQASFHPGALGLPDRDYYTNTGASADSTRDAYLAHVARLFTLAGQDAASARADAARVLALETELAKVSLTRVQRRDPAATHNPMPLTQLRTLAPAVDWAAYFRGIGLTVPVGRVNVSEPAYLRRMNELLAATPLAGWRALLRFHALEGAAPWLSDAFVREDFAFSSRFTGARELLPRWKRCLQVTDAQAGEALGQAYVARTFPPQARDRARQVIEDVRTAFGERIRRLEWMSDATRAQALEKLSRMGGKVGYPEQWRDYSRLEVAEGPFVLNLQRANAFEWARRVNRPGTPVDKTEWEMTVPTVNAYYDPTKNEMVFPAGALVPQTFDPTADDAANYGSLGASWAGHELTHGFDDEGRRYDAAGNLRDWWTPADSAHFSRQATVVAEQFDAYVQVDTLRVNGRLTLGENIADYGGLLTAYDALQRALQRNGRPGPIDGWTPEQRFFLSYAQAWRSNVRPEALRNRVTVDPHAPEEWRVNGPLSNMPSFAAAFGCKPGDPMVRPADKIPSIW